VPNVGQPCNDNNACTVGETIQCNGTCGGGNPVVCNDNNSCTTDTCNPQSGCVYSPISGVHNECVGSSCQAVSNTANSCTNQCSSNLDCSTPQISADIKANNNDGPISITYNTNATISWSSNNASSCYVSPGGWTGTSGSQSSPNLTSNTTYNLSCIDSSNNSATDSVQIRILGVSLLASPNNGTAPLNNVSLTATVSEYSNGTFKYFFDCNNDNIDELVTQDIWVNPYTANNLCSYSSPGVYTAKVRVFHNFGQAVTTTTITVNAGPPQTLSVSISANPSSGNAPLLSNLTATVSGTAIGTINYSIWWNCNNPSNSVSTAESACGALPNPSLGNCLLNSNGYKCNSISSTTLSIGRSYDTPGTYNPKVIVERGSATPAESRTTITVNSSPPTSTNYILNVYLGGTGSGRVTSSPSGINCPSNCSASFTSGTNVRLQATPSPGSQFSGWSGDCSGNNTTCQVTMNSSKLVNATFNLTGGGGGNEHLECTSNNTCERVQGAGPNRCSTNEDCGSNSNYKLIGKCEMQDIDNNGIPDGPYCVNKKCDPSSQNCVSECSTKDGDIECGFTPPPPAQTTYLECYGNACVIKGGSGTNTCTKIGISGPQCRPTIREIMPFLNPPSINNFLKNTALIFVSLFNK
jgi:hypothetical protein